MTALFVMPLADVGSGIKPSDGARLFFFESDGVTPKNTHSTKAGVPGEPGNLNSNPVDANANGVFPEIYITGDYKVTLKDKNDVQIFGLIPVNEFAAVTDGVFIKNFATLAAAQADANIVAGKDVAKLEERSTGNGGGASWAAVTGDTPNGFDVVAHDTLPLQLKLIHGKGIIIDKLGAVENGDVTSVLNYVLNSDDYVQAVVPFDCAITNFEVIKLEKSLKGLFDGEYGSLVSISMTADAVTGIKSRNSLFKLSNIKMLGLSGTVEKGEDVTQIGIEFTGDLNSNNLDSEVDNCTFIFL